MCKPRMVHVCTYHPPIHFIAQDTCKRPKQGQCIHKAVFGENVFGQLSNASRTKVLKNSAQQDNKTQYHRIDSIAMHEVVCMSNIARK